MSYYAVTGAKTMKMLDTWVNPDYDGRCNYGPMSVKKIEEGELIEVWDRSDDPDDIRFYLKPHKNFTYWGDRDGMPEFCGRKARSIAALAIPVEDNLVSIFLRTRSKSRLIVRLIESGQLTVPELKRMILATEQYENEQAKVVS